MELDLKPNKVLNLRLVKAEDIRMIWEWANDPETRSASFSTISIPFEKHAKWFSAKLSDKNCLFFIIFNADDIPIGQFRCDINGHEGVVSISLSPGQRGKGYGSQVIRLATRRVFESTLVDIIHAYIKVDNIQSLKAFSRAGFLDNGLVEIRGNLAHEYVSQRKVDRG